MPDQFKSQMNFLQTYHESFERRKEQIEEKKQQSASMENYVLQYNRLQEEIKELEKENRQDEKFLISMNDMVLRNTDQPVSNGPLFNSGEETDEDAA